MKANLIYNRKSIVVDIQDYLAYTSIMLDEISPEFYLFEDIYKYVCGEYIKVARVMLDERINHCEFKHLVFKEQKDEGIIDNIHFYIVEHGKD